MKPRNGGEAILLRLKQLGVDYFFANPGTEFPSLIRGFHDLPKGSVPTPVLAPHELQAVTMAYGYTLGTGRPQAVMTHATVGAANALIGLIGAARMNIPLIFLSGMTSRTERGVLGSRDKLIHWAQDSVDQGAMFREYVKAEIEISDLSTVYDALDRAYAIATTAPCGPVAVKLCRDILLSTGLSPLPARIGVVAATAAAPDPVEFSKFRDELAHAERPLLVTNRLGSDPKLVPLLQKVSESHGIGVLTPEDFYLSFPSTHANHLGYRPNAALREADLVIVLDTETPWYPLEQGPVSSAKVVHVGCDPLFSRIPLRSHEGQVFLQSSPELFLRGFESFAPAAGKWKGRRAWIAAMKARPEGPRQCNGSDALGQSAILGEFLDPNTLVVNELGLAPEALGCRYPGNYFRSGSASPLGSGLGQALGLALAHPGKPVIAAVGDGVFFLSPVPGALLTSAELGLPLVVLVLNNGGMRSISRTVTEFYPEATGHLPLTSFASRGVAIEKCAAMVSGLGLRAADTAQLRGCLAKALEFVVKERRPAIINALIP